MAPSLALPVRLLVLLVLAPSIGGCRSTRTLGDADVARASREAAPGFDLCAKKVDAASATTVFRIKARLDVEGRVTTAIVDPAGPLDDCFRAAVLGLRVDPGIASKEAVEFAVAFARNEDGSFRASHSAYRSLGIDDVRALAETCATDPPYGDGTSVPEPRRPLAVVLRNEVDGEVRFKRMCLSLDGKTLLAGAVLERSNEAFARGATVTWRGPVADSRHVLFAYVVLRNSGTEGPTYEMRLARVLTRETRKLEVVIYGAPDLSFHEKLPALRFIDTSEDVPTPGETVISH